MKILTKLSLALALIIFLTLIISRQNNLEERLQTSGVNSDFTFDVSRTFEEYVKHSRNIIASGRINFGEENKEQIIAWNSPFILNSDQNKCQKSNKGILLIHGLSDSPFTTRDLANHLNENCFTVYSIHLVGHGTRPGDLREVSYKDWVKQVEYGVKELSKKTDEIYLAGYSTGSILAMNYILSNPSVEIEALIGLSPAFNLKKFAWLASVVKYFKKYNHIYDDQDLVKYESFAMNATEQIYLLTKEFDKNLKKNNLILQNTKIFMAMSYEDQTIDAQKTLKTILGNTNPDKRHIILYHQNDLPEDIASEKNLYPVKSSILEEKILNLSHVSLPNNAQNIWYGENAKYRNCMHYYQEKEYDICKKSREIFRGEVTEENLNKGILTRISYNPFMDKLLADLDQFLLPLM
jgi:esterase/lipase